MTPILDAIEKRLVALGAQRPRRIRVGCCLQERLAREVTSSVESLERANPASVTFFCDGPAQVEWLFGLPVNDDLGGCPDGFALD